MTDTTELQPGQPSKVTLNFRTARGKTFPVDFEVPPGAPGIAGANGKDGAQGKPGAKVVRASVQINRS